MNTGTSLIKNIRVVKITALITLTILTLTVFILLFLDNSLMSEILSNTRLFSFCILLWIMMLICFAAISFDFVMMKRHYDITKNLDELALLDKLTGLPNRFSVDRMSEKYNTREKLLHLGCILITINNLTEINEQKGREGGDRVISDFCSILESVGHKYGQVGRNSGNEFLMLIEDCDRNDMELFLGDLQRRIHNHNTIAPEYPIELKYNSLLSDSIMAEHFYTLVTSVYQSFDSNAQILI